MQSDRVDKSAVGWDHIEKVEKHESQKDYSKGFGGKFGVQEDRKDKSAVGWDYVEKPQQHESQLDHKIVCIKTPKQRCLVHLLSYVLFSIPWNSVIGSLLSLDNQLQSINEQLLTIIRILCLNQTFYFERDLVENSAFKMIEWTNRR